MLGRYKTYLRISPAAQTHLIKDFAQLNLMNQRPCWNEICHLLKLIDGKKCEIIIQNVSGSNYKRHS